MIDDPLFHLGCRTSREGHQQDVLGLDSRLIDNIGVPTGNGQRLPGASPGIDEIDPLGAVDKLLLLLIWFGRGHWSPSRSKSR